MVGRMRAAIAIVGFPAFLYIGAATLQSTGWIVLVLDLVAAAALAPLARSAA
jgi:hypothetical protein